MNRIVGASVLLTILILFPGKQRSQEARDQRGSDQASQIFTVTNVNNSGAGSLRQAITDANNNTGLDTIAFAIAGSGVQIINITSVLPTVTDPVVIDGTTQTGYSGTPLVAVRGSGTSEALNITAGGSTIKGLTFIHFTGTTTNGIVRLATVGNNVVTACTFGIRGDNVVDTNGNDTIMIDGTTNNRVGGSVPADRNYFGGDTFQLGVTIKNGGSGNRVVGNYFGVGPNGSAQPMRISVKILDSPNNFVGGTASVTPGGACTGECNVISGNDDTIGGIQINGAGSTGNVVIANMIGLMPDGMTVNANRIAGIRITDAPNNRVGGTTAAERNVITGTSNLGRGVLIENAGSTGNVVSGNYIGVKTDGVSTIASASSATSGVQLQNSTATRVGGLLAGERNIISGSKVGIFTVGSSKNLVQGNYIGTDFTGMNRSTTANHGIWLTSGGGNVIGGPTGTTPGSPCTGACNVISGNGTDGMSDGINIGSSNNNTIDGNYIGLNAAGAAAILNGITTNGQTFNGAAIRFINSSNNTIGRDTRVPAAAADRAPMRPEASCSVQDDRYRDFMGIAGPIPGGILPGVVLTMHCLPGPLATNTTGIVVDHVDLSTTTPGYIADSPFINRLYGQSAFTPFNTGAKLRFTSSVSPLGAAIIPFYRWYGDHTNDFAAPNCQCPTEAIQLMAGPVFFKGDPGSDNNRVQSNFFGYQANGVLPLDLPQYTTFTIDQFSNGNQITGPRVFNPGNVPTFYFRENGNSVDDFRGFNQLQRGASPGGNVGDFGHLVNFSPIKWTRLVDPFFTWRVQAQISGLPPNASFVPQIYASAPVPAISGDGESYGEYLHRLATFPPIVSNGTGNAVLDRTINGLEGFGIEFEKQTRVVLTEDVFDNGGEAPNTDVTGTIVAISQPVIVPHGPYDLDGDRITDFAVYRPGSGQGASVWYVLNSSDNSVRAMPFGSASDVIVPGEYQGDGKWDIAVFRPSSGIWFVARTLGTPAQDFDTVTFGLSSDIPVVGDFDGDGRSDPTIVRNGTWWTLPSLTGAAAAQQFGATGDKLAAADYNGDGRTDIAIYRNGQWWISPCPACTPRVEQFGVSGDLPVPADYDGDGRADIAVWRPSTGTWYLLQTSAGFAAYQWGASGDTPIDGDFDGDGKNDPAVWRPATGDFWILQSGDGQLRAFHWGQNGDIPVARFQNAAIP